jgi:hypothetical protein
MHFEWKTIQDSSPHVKPKSMHIMNCHKCLSDDVALSLKAFKSLLKKKGNIEQRRLNNKHSIS